MIHGFHCLDCGGQRSTTVDGPVLKGAGPGAYIRRRRECLDCGARYTTREVAAWSSGSNKRRDSGLRTIKAQVKADKASGLSLKAIQRLRDLSEAQVKRYLYATPKKRSQT